MSTWTSGYQTSRAYGRTDEGYSKPSYANTWGAALGNTPIAGSGVWNDEYGDQHGWWIGRSFLFLNIPDFGQVITSATLNFTPSHGTSHSGADFVYPHIVTLQLPVGDDHPNSPAITSDYYQGHYWGDFGSKSFTEAEFGVAATWDLAAQAVDWINQHQGKTCTFCYRDYYDMTKTYPDANKETNTWTGNVTITLTYSGEATAFDVTTLPATDITNSSVKLHGHVSKVGTTSSDIVQYGFDMRQAGEEEYSVHNEWFFDDPITTESLFNATFGGSILPDNTSFYFRAKAMNTLGLWCYGEELTFDTGPFTVVTNDAADVTAVSATISGSATVDTGVSDVLIKKTGMHYGLDLYMNGGASFYTNITPATTADFSTALAYLYPETTYYCVASAIAEVDGVDVELFGEIKEFTTLSTELTVYTRAATSISYTSAKLNMEALSSTKPILWFGFEYGTTETYSHIVKENCGNTYCSTYENKWVKCGITIKGLTEDTTYHFRAMGYCDGEDVAYGDDLTFTTRGEGGLDGECDDGMHHCPGTVTMTPTIRVSARGLSGKDVLRLKTDEQALGGSYIVDLDNSDDSLDNVDCLGPASIYMSPPTQTLKVTIVGRQTFSEEGTKYLRITCIDPLAELRQSSAMLATIGGFVFNEREFTDTTLHSEAYVTEYTADCWNKTIAEIINAITEGCIGITTTFPCNTSDCVVNTLTPHIVAVNAMTGVMDALSYVEGGLRWDGTNLVYIPPSLMSGMNIYSSACALYVTAQGSGIAIPNYVWCWGVPYDTAGVMNDLNENIIVNWKADSYSVYRIGRPIHKHIIFDKNLITGATDAAKTDTLLTIATAKLARVQEDSAESIVVVLPTCKERLFNKVRASDRRGNVVTGVVHRIERFYEANTGIYTYTLHLGGQLGAADTITTVTNPSESVRID